MKWRIGKLFELILKFLTISLGHPALYYLATMYKNWQKVALTKVGKSGDHNTLSATQYTKHVPIFYLLFIHWKYQLCKNIPTYIDKYLLLYTNNLTYLKAIS